MGAQQSKVRISVPKKAHCFPTFLNETELYQTVRKVEECHTQAVKIATWISAVVLPGYTPGPILVSAASMLFTFLLHRLSASLPPGEAKVSSSSSSTGSMDTQSDPTLEDALIESKVSQGIARKSVCELQAKLCVVKNRYHRLLSDISPDDRRLEVVPGIQTCEEILQLFHDPTHVFRMHPLVSAPFLVTFSGIFVALAELSLVLIPSYIVPLVGEMNLMKDTLEAYKAACIQVRMKSIKFKSIEPTSMLDAVANMSVTETSYRMEDTCMINTRVRHNNNPLRSNCESEQGESEEAEEEERAMLYHTTNEAISAYKNLLEDKYSKFFNPAFETVAKFSGFNTPGPSRSGHLYRCSTYQKEIAETQSDTEF